MISPSWFFATLAQSTAAIIGFLIALSSIHYQLERRRIEQNTDELRKDLIDFKQNYEEVLGISAFLIRKTSPDITNDIEEDEIKIVEDPEYPELKTLFQNILKISKIISSIDSSTDNDENYLLKEEEFDSVKNCFDEIDEIISITNNEKLREEIADLKSIDKFAAWDENVLGNYEPGTQHTEGNKIAKTEAGVVQNWLEDKYSFSSRLSGRNLRSIYKIIENSRRDFFDINTKKERSIVTYQPTVRPIFLLTVGLLFVGVFLPIAFLITPSDGFLIITGKRLLIAQVSLLLVTFSLTVYLAYSIINEL